MHALGARLDDYRALYQANGYDPEYGYGDEASRPPNFEDPEDKLAYPNGVICSHR